MKPEEYPSYLSDLCKILRIENIRIHSDLEMQRLFQGVDATIGSVRFIQDNDKQTLLIFVDDHLAATLTCPRLYSGETKIRWHHYSKPLEKEVLASVNEILKRHDAWDEKQKRIQKEEAEKAEKALAAFKEKYEIV